MTSIGIDGVLNARSFSRPSAWLVASGPLQHITPQERDRIAELGVAVILDLSDQGEPSGPAVPPGTPQILHIPLRGTASRPSAVGETEDSYSALVRERGRAIAAAVGAIADADGAVLVHCPVGADGTPLVVALALLLGGTPPEEVLADLALAGAPIDSSRPVYALRQALQLIDEFGGPHAYLLRHGMTPEQFTRIRDRAAAAHGADPAENAA